MWLSLRVMHWKCRAAITKLFSPGVTSLYRTAPQTHTPCRALCTEAHIDKHSGDASIPPMDRDDVNDAFARWKAAQDAFLATEHRFFLTAGLKSHQPLSKRAREEDPLFMEVQAKRAHAEKLLLFAMKLLHERRQM